jgi:hypothetical protein
MTFRSVVEKCRYVYRNWFQAAFVTCSKLKMYTNAMGCHTAREQTVCQI